MQVINEGGVPIKAWVDGVQLEAQARQQLVNVSQLPFIFKHIAVMPDVHWGVGATVGSVIPTEKAIIPAAVGVDIGCGMMAVQTTLTASDLPDNLKEIRTAIEAAVPHGRTDDGGKNDRGAWGHTPSDVIKTFNAHLAEDFNSLMGMHPKLKRGHDDCRQLGTLGTGNHFIEVCLDETQAVWFMLHSGSRGIGNRIGTYFINLAKEDMQRFFINLPDKDLAYLPEGTDHYKDYLFAVKWAQRFAKLNREQMMERVVGAVAKLLPPFHLTDKVVNCHHNYVNMENHFGKNVLVTRKGAVRAREGDYGIIPGSMGTGSFIVRGKGNPDSFNSCSHGAGRAMSRNAARKKFTLEDHAKATEGVECRKDADVIDETPMAYKPIGDVMAAQSDLVDIVHTLKQVICVKG